MNIPGQVRDGNIQRRLRAYCQPIHSEDSPVGIDAKKTHVVIIRKLEEIERRLERIEAKMPADE